MNTFEATTLLALADEPTAKQIAADIESGYLRWQFDDYTAALVTDTNRVAVVLYPASGDEPADFETAEWYNERI